MGRYQLSCPGLIEPGGCPSRRNREQKEKGEAAGTRSAETTVSGLRRASIQVLARDLEGLPGDKPEPIVRSSAHELAELARRASSARPRPGRAVPIAFSYDAAVRRHKASALGAVLPGWCAPAKLGSYPHWRADNGGALEGKPNRRLPPPTNNHHSWKQGCGLQRTFQSLSKKDCGGAAARARG